MKISAAMIASYPWRISNPGPRKTLADRRHSTNSEVKRIMKLIRFYALVPSLYKKLIRTREAKGGSPLGADEGRFAPLDSVVSVASRQQLLYS